MNSRPPNRYRARSTVEEEEPWRSKRKISQLGLTRKIRSTFDARSTGLVDGKVAEVVPCDGPPGRIQLDRDASRSRRNSRARRSTRLPELTGVENLEVVSSSANDDASPAGTGASSIRIGYIDTSNNLVVSPDISMNGTTPVALAFKAKFILWMEIIDRRNERGGGRGTSYFGSWAPGATQEQITAGGNRSLSCRFMVPTGYKGYLVDWGCWALRRPRTSVSGPRSGRGLGPRDGLRVPIDCLYGGRIEPVTRNFLIFSARRSARSRSAPFRGAPAGIRIDTEFTILLIAD